MFISKDFDHIGKEALLTTSNFNTDLSGWVTSIGSETYAATDGNPGGSIRGVEGGAGVWYFQAPDAYLGDRAAYYGGSISFDLRQDVDTSQFDENDILLTGGGIALALDMGPNPGTDWTSYSANLSLGGGLEDRLDHWPCGNRGRDTDSSG